MASFPMIQVSPLLTTPELIQHNNLHINPSQHTLEDPLDDEASLKEQLDRLPVICLFQVCK